MDAYSMAVTPVKVRKMDWLHIDTTPSNENGTRFSHGLVTPLSANDCRRDYGAGLSSWPVTGDFTCKSSFTPPSERFSSSVNLSTASSFESWEDFCQSSSPTSPYEYLNCSQPLTPQFNSAAEDRDKKQDQGWSLVQSNKLSNGDQPEFTPYHSTRTLLSGDVHPFQSDYTVPESSSFAEGIHAMLPAQINWGVYLPSSSGDQVRDRIDAGHVLPSQNSCHVHEQWQPLGEFHDIQMSDAYSELPIEVYEDKKDIQKFKAECKNEHETGCKIEYKSEDDFAQGASSPLKDKKSINIKERLHSPAFTPRPATKITKRRPATKRIKVKEESYRVYETKLGNALIDVSIQSDIPQDHKGNFVVGDGKKQDNCVCEWEGCNKIFKRSEHLHRHEFTHSGLQPFKCAYCSRRFNRKDNRQVHYTTHMGFGKVKDPDFHPNMLYCAIMEEYEDKVDAAKDVEALKNWYANKVKEVARGPLLNNKRN